MRTNDGMTEEEAMALLQEQDPELAEKIAEVDVDKLTFEDDFTIFMSHKVPDIIRRRALSKLWLSDPLLANLDGLNDYDEDFAITSKDNRIFDVNLLSETTSDILRLSVHSLTGQRVVYTQVGKNSAGVYNHRLDMNGMSSGVYIVTIGNAKTQLTKQILVR